jgi:hypothetical protein
VYQVKSNKITSLSVNSIKTSEHPNPTAVLYGEANIRNVSKGAKKKSEDRSATFQVTLTDAGEPGTADKIGIAVWNSDGELWFASNWDGNGTVEQRLAKGNLKVHIVKPNDKNAVPTASSQKATSTIEEAHVSKLSVKALSNPTSTYFTLRIRSNSQKPVELRVVDAVGRVVEVKRRVGANSTVAVGHQYRPGTYFAQVVQNGKKASLKLVKASQET